MLIDTESGWTDYRRFIEVLDSSVKFIGPDIRFLAVSIVASAPDNIRCHLRRESNAKSNGIVVGDCWNGMKWMCNKDYFIGSFIHWLRFFNMCKLCFYNPFTSFWNEFKRPFTITETIKFLGSIRLCYERFMYFNLKITLFTDQFCLRCIIQ